MVRLIVTEVCVSGTNHQKSPEVGLYIFVADLPESMFSRDEVHLSVRCFLVVPDGVLISGL